MKHFLFFISFFIMMFPTNLVAQTVPQQTPKSQSLKNIPDAYIKEALQFHAECEQDEKLNNYYNCKCLSGRYLDEKIKGGKNIGKSAIMLTLERECLDATKSVGPMYSQCLTTYNLMPKMDKKPQDFCNCFANEYAKLFEKLKLPPGSTTFIALQERALLQCQNPALAKRLYN